jgi:C_GCAxxG_C_C family probable redox protein
MKEKNTELAYKRAAEHFREGYNCTQSVLMAGQEALGLEIPSDIIKATAGFSGGIGYSGCVCGALTGAVMLIGLARQGLGGGLGQSETDARRNRRVAKESAQFYRWFEKEFSSPCCRIIRQGRPFSNKEVEKRCTEVTAQTARKVVDILRED